MKTALKLFGILTLIAIIGCSKDDPIETPLPEAKETQKSSDKKIRSFVFDTTSNAGLNENIIASINESDKTINATVPHGTDITAFIPIIATSDKASVSPTGAQDFSAPVAYTITAEDNSKTTYTVTITPALNTEKAILSFQFFLSENPFDVNVIAEIDEDKKHITFDVPDGADISALMPTITISTNATISPNGQQNFEAPVIYTVTAEDGSLISYVAKAIRSQRSILLDIYKASPNNSLGWDIESSDINNWQGVTTDVEGNVTELSLNVHNLANVPASIGLLSHLTILELFDTQITELPNEIGQLSKLTRLYISDSRLKGLPDEIWQLINLTELYLNNNQFTEIPSEIGNLTNLNYLTLSHNQLTEIPAEIGNLTNMISLELNNNQLTKIPREIGNLTNLIGIRLYNNQLITLPREIGKLTNLNRLVLFNNRFTEIPSEIGNLISLTSLSLANNQLFEIPSEIGNLSNLTDLGLKNNLLTQIPVEIGNLINLANLNLEQNPLITIPQAICDLETNHGTNITTDAGVTCK